MVATWSRILSLRFYILPLPCQLRFVGFNNELKTEKAAMSCDTF